MKKIRAKVFETNSSSCHSLSIEEGRGMEEFNIPVNSKNQVTCRFGSYSRADCGYLNNQYDKLTYLLTYVAVCELRKRYYSKNDNPVDEFVATEGFQMINEFLKKHCDGINIEGISGLSLVESDVNDGTYEAECAGEIDHESLHADTLKGWFEYHNIDIGTFILNGDYAYVIEAC